METSKDSNPGLRKIQIGFITIKNFLDGDDKLCLNESLDLPFVARIINLEAFIAKYRLITILISPVNWTDT